MRRVPALLLTMAIAGLGASCGTFGADDAAPTATRAGATDPTSITSTTAVVPTTAVSTSAPTPLPTSPRPDWLGTRVLPLRPDGLGEIQPTPDELVDRRFATVDTLPPPATKTFEVSVEPVPDVVLARSTWVPSCPVDRSELRYVTLPFWGFDGLLHTGELLVNEDAVAAVLAGFEHLFDRGFPIEEMRITTAGELEAPPTGDGNDTGAFVCRPSVGSTSWSQHAYGRAVDINPFHNPYVRGDVVIPELASSYVARPDLPGVLGPDDVAGFVDAGWGWGGSWASSKDFMHVSASGR